MQLPGCSDNNIGNAADVALNEEAFFAFIVPVHRLYVDFVLLKVEYLLSGS
jgi:hypothetical protein